MCPSVSSPASSPPVQSTRSTPSISVSTRSRAVRSRPGLRRASTTHRSLTRSVPSPSVSIAPPSSTMPPSNTGRPSRPASVRDTRASSSHGGYFPPHAFHRNVTAAGGSPEPDGGRRKTGPVSRSHASFVAISSNSTPPTSARSRRAAASGSPAARIRTGSCAAITRAIVANTGGTSAKSPSHVARRCGHARKVARCGSHSAGSR